MGNGIKKVNLDNLMNDFKINNIQKSNVQSHNMARGVIEAVGDILTQGSTDAQQAKIAELESKYAKNGEAKVSYDSEGNAIVDCTHIDNNGDRSGSIFTVDKNGVRRKAEIFKGNFNEDLWEPTHEIIEYDRYGNREKYIREYDTDGDGYYNLKDETHYDVNTDKITYYAESNSEYTYRETYYKDGKKEVFNYLKDGSYSHEKYSESGKVEQIKYYDGNGKSISESEYERRHRVQSNENAKK